MYWKNEQYTHETRKRKEKTNVSASGIKKTKKFISVLASLVQWLPNEKVFDKEPRTMEAVRGKKEKEKKLATARQSWKEAEG